MGKTLAVVIITKNEEDMIVNCLATVAFADQIIVVDSGSSDNTVEIARREGATIISAQGGTFADWRNAALEELTTDWVLYLDADERVTPKLAKEIEETIKLTSVAAFGIRRNNIHFGKWMQAGGWEKDLLIRLFDRQKLIKWEGDVHEHAVFEGTVGQLSEPLVHLTHRSLIDGLIKSRTWTDIEAELLFEAGVPKVKGTTLIRKMGVEFLRRYLFKKGYRDGMEGLIESLQQAMNRFFVYERLWELQQKPSVQERYQRFEKEIAGMWKGKR